MRTINRLSKVWKEFIVKANKFLLTAILASAIGTLIVAVAKDKSVPTSSQMSIEGELPARQCNGVAQFAAIDGRRPAGKSRPHRLLDLFLHQLATHTSLCPRVGREI